MFDFLAKGGILVIPILFCSVLALAIFLERVINFARMRRKGSDIAEKRSAFRNREMKSRLLKLLMEATRQWARCSSMQ